MRNGNLEIGILVKGRPITEFAHQGQSFIEGRPGSDFEIKVTNHSAQRTMAVVSVDGLSIMDGKAASEDSPGYLVHPYASVTIPGWMIDQSKVAKFTFGSRKESYAQTGKGNATNCGVIGVMMFAEKVKPIPQWFGTAQTTTLGSPGWNGLPLHSGLRGMVKGASASGSTESYTEHLEAKKMLSDAMFASTSLTASVESSATYASNASASVNNLGTQFGGAADFATKQVDFEKGGMIATAALYYDDSRGLKARGIVLERASRQRYQATPNPFPASTIGCSPPKGWSG